LSKALFPVTLACTNCFFIYFRVHKISISFSQVAVTLSWGVALLVVSVFIPYSNNIMIWSVRKLYLGHYIHCDSTSRNQRPSSIQYLRCLEDDIHNGTRLKWCVCEISSTYQAPGTGGDLPLWCRHSVMLWKRWSNTPSKRYDYAPAWTRMPLWKDRDHTIISPGARVTDTCFRAGESMFDIARSSQQGLQKWRDRF